jgi:hypothetical protein
MGRVTLLNAALLELFPCPKARIPFGDFEFWDLLTQVLNEDRG